MTVAAEQSGGCGQTTCLHCSKMCCSSSTTLVDLRMRQGLSLL